MLAAMPVPWCGLTREGSDASLLKIGVVVVVHHPDEHARLAPAKTIRGLRRALDGLPGHLEEQALLGIHLHRFARGDPEECAVEHVDAVEEATPLRPHLAQLPGLRIVERLDVPPIGRYLTDCIDAVAQQAPKRFRTVRAREAARHADHGDRFAHLPDEGSLQLIRRNEPHAEEHRTQPLVSSLTLLFGQRGSEVLVRQDSSSDEDLSKQADGRLLLVRFLAAHQMLGERLNIGMIEQERRGKRATKGSLQGVAKLDRHQRGQVQLAKGLAQVDEIGWRDTERPRDVAFQVLDEHFAPLRRGRRRKLLCERRWRQYRRAPRGSTSLRFSPR